MFNWSQELCSLYVTRLRSDVKVVPRVESFYGGIRINSVFYVMSHMINTCAIFDVARMYPTKIRIVTELINHKPKKKNKKTPWDRLSFILTFNIFFNLIFCYRLDCPHWVAVTSQQRHPQPVHNCFARWPDGPVCRRCVWRNETLPPEHCCNYKKHYIKAINITTKILVSRYSILKSN